MLNNQLLVSWDFGRLAFFLNMVLLMGFWEIEYALPLRLSHTLSIDSRGMRRPKIVCFFLEANPTRKAANREIGCNWHAQGLK